MADRVSKHTRHIGLPLNSMNRYSTSHFDWKAQFSWLSFLFIFELFFLAYDKGPQGRKIGCMQAPSIGEQYNYNDGCGFYYIKNDHPRAALSEEAGCMQPTGRQLPIPGLTFVCMSTKLRDTRLDSNRCTCFYTCTQTFSSVSCVFAALWSTMAGRRLAFNSPSTPLHGRDQPLSASPQTGEKTLLNAISGLSRQLTWFAADVNEQFTVVNPWLLSIEDRLDALVSKKRKRREDGCTIPRLW